MHFTKAFAAVLAATANLAAAAPVANGGNMLAARDPEPQNRGGQIYSKRDPEPEPVPQNRGGQIYSKRDPEPDPQSRGGQIYSKRDPGPQNRGGQIYSKRDPEPEPQNRGGQIYSKRDPEPQNRGGQIYSKRSPEPEPEPQNRGGQIYSKRDPEPQNRGGQIYSKRDPEPEPQNRGGQIYSSMMPEPADLLLSLTHLLQNTVKKEVTGETLEVRFTAGLLYDENRELYRPTAPGRPEYVGTPTPELDAAWKDLVGVNVFVTKEEEPSLGGGLYLEPDSDLYMAEQPPQAPPLFKETPSSILDKTKALIEQTRNLQDQITNTVRPEEATFANTVLPLAQKENENAVEAHILRFYSAVSTDNKLRDASIKAENLLDSFSVEASMREDLYLLVDAVVRREEYLDTESALLLKKEHRSYFRNGLGLSGPERERFKEIKKRLYHLNSDFQRNLNEENGGIWFTVEELEGLPEDVLRGLEKGALNSENKGKLRLTFKYPDLFPALTYAKRSETRKKVFVGNDNKCNQNVPILKETLALRDEAARLLGYPNHASYRIGDKMAPSLNMVNTFLDDLKVMLSTRGAQELEKLKKLKRNDISAPTFDDRYHHWDHRYYCRLMLENEYSFDHQMLSEYFPLKTTIDGMLRVYQDLFGLVFEELTDWNHHCKWNEDVQLFSVWDDEAMGSGFVGYLYLDLHPREGKFGHAANFNLQPGFLGRDGKRWYPSTAVVCNFTKPTPKKPSLMKHEEVISLFHELGHAIHDLVSKTAYSRFHGTRTADDFCEMPSKMLENWCWDPSVLRALGQHYSTLSPEYFEAWRADTDADYIPHEKIPADMIDRLLRTKHVNVALFYLRQVHVCIFDMKIHQPESHEAVCQMDISATYNLLREDITMMDGPDDLYHEWGHGQVTFGHLMEGYDVGYYGYLSAEVYALDIFHTFFKKNPMNTKEGRRYRLMILEKGGSQEEMKTLMDFLGREPRTDSFYKELHIG
ncbi:metallopeptidase MepB [Paecilomyces variotii No. 5]|uniref:Metallopeptidase MepB n=1 Tax=Byssochlamys spectabilis (strain No. 5 / NBRC 109023) TaxID=1356009 RepID=V5G2P3_BYSSN|nr:metallopeptidase MepB [Paecilomyces variotii No. 5]